MSVLPLLAQVQLQDAGSGTAAGVWLLRFADYATLAITIGLLLMALVGHDRGPVASLAVRRAAVAALAWSAAAGLLFVLATSNASARPLPDALDPTIARQFAGTRFGQALTAQAALALACALVAVRARRRGAVMVALAVAGLAAAAPVWWGHAGSNELRVVAITVDWLHVLGVAAWMGGLAALVLLSRRLEHDDLAAMVARFSVVAGWALGIVVLTGVGNTLLGVSAPGQLLDTTWGRLALGKMSLLVGIAALGWRQRARTVPALRAAADRTSAVAVFRRIAAGELVLMLAAVGLATTMATGVPAKTEVASRIQSLAAAFGDGQLNVTVDPASVGANVAHVYFLDDTGQLRRDVTQPSVTLDRQGRQVQAQLLPAGPGHWVAPSLRLPEAGPWRLQVTALLDGVHARIVATITVR